MVESISTPAMSEGEEAEDNLYFASTQMQSKHDDNIIREKEQKIKAHAISKLKGFANAGPGKYKGAVTKGESKVAKKTRKKNASKSMSALVRDNFEKSRLFPYFSGDQTKIDDFMARLRKMEDLENLNPKSSLKLFSHLEWNHILRCIKLKFPNLTTTRKKNLKLITKKIHEFELQNDAGLWSQASTQPKIEGEELKWLYDLTEEQMANNTTINDDVDPDDGHYVMILSQNIGQSTQDSEHSVIEILDSELEPEVLIRNDSDITSVEPVFDPSIKHDADISSRQVESVFDPTISFQSFPFAEVKSKETKRHIPDEAPIFEVISSLPLSDKITQEFPEGHITVASKESSTVDQNTSKVFKEFFVSSSEYSRQVEINNQGKSILLDENNQPLLESFTQKHEVINSPLNQEAIESLLRLEIIESPPKRDIILTPSKKSPAKRVVEDSPFKTPTKRPKRLLNHSPSRDEINLAKELGSPVKSSPLLANRNYSTISDSSPIQSPLIGRTPIKLVKNSSTLREEEEECIQSTGESIYSTAKSQLQTQYGTPEIFDSIPRRKKVLNTTRYEVRSEMNVKEYYDSQTKIGVRKVGSKVIDLDLENEIADSEDDENDISIIEITREIDNDEVDDENGEANTSILQVPSSPSLGQILPEENLDSPTHIHSQVPSQLSQLTTKQLKSKIVEWGLKPVKSRVKMVQVLDETSKLIIESSQLSSKSQLDVTNLFVQSQTTQQIKENINVALNQLIKQDQYWHEKVISYDPIKTEELQEWLVSIGYDIELDIVKRYCDDVGITTRQ